MFLFLALNELNAKHKPNLTKTNYVIFKQAIAVMSTCQKMAKLVLNKSLTSGNDFTQLGKEISLIFSNFCLKIKTLACPLIESTFFLPCVCYRCDISVCYKPDSSSDWRLSQTSAQIQPLNPTFCSLLCLPIVTFSGALP